MARLAATPYVIDHSPADGSFSHEAWQAEDAELMELLKRSDELPVGEINGYVCKWQRADGYAYYIVSNERPLTLQHVACGDSWQVEGALIRGLRRSDILEMQQRDQAWRELFSNHSVGN